MKQRGFTVVELLVVVIVIAILATVVAVGYGQLQRQGRDAQTREGATKIAEAIELLYVKHGLTPRTAHANWGSDGGLKSENGKTVCTDNDGNSTGSGYIGRSLYQCTMSDILVHYQLLPDGFIESMPINSKFKNASPKNGSRTYMTYPCVRPGTQNDFALLYTLEEPNEKDIEEYDRVISECGVGGGQRSNYNMQGVIYIDYE